VRVFVENEAGSNRKNIHDEKTLNYKNTVAVSRPYPFPYGFVLDTTNEDGDNLDCFIITRQILRTGQIVDCSVVGLMEQTEDGKEDHNVVAVPSNESAELTAQVKETLVDFVMHVFEHEKGKVIQAGRFRSPKEARTYLEKCLDRKITASHGNED